MVHDVPLTARCRTGYRGCSALNKDFPKPIRNVWLSSFLFFGLTWWDSYGGIVNKPALTAYILLWLIRAAVGIAVGL